MGRTLVSQAWLSLALSGGGLQRSQGARPGLATPSLWSTPFIDLPKGSSLRFMLPGRVGGQSSLQFPESCGQFFVC